MSIEEFLTLTEKCECIACTSQGKTTKKGRRRAPIGLSQTEAKAWRRQRASSRELRRIHELQAAFDVLRQLVPISPNDDRPSKLQVLRQATDYVRLLRSVLRQEKDGTHSKGTFPPVSERPAFQSHQATLPSCSSASHTSPRSDQAMLSSPRLPISSPQRSPSPRSRHHGVSASDSRGHSVAGLVQSAVVTRSRGFVWPSQPPPDQTISTEVSREKTKKIIL